MFEDNFPFKQHQILVSAIWQCGFRRLTLVNSSRVVLNLARDLRNQRLSVTHILAEETAAPS
jgi:hypothetical protein